MFAESGSAGKVNPKGLLRIDNDFCFGVFWGVVLVVFFFN